MKNEKQGKRKLCNGATVSGFMHFVLYKVCGVGLVSWARGIELVGEASNGKTEVTGTGLCGGGDPLVAAQGAHLVSIMRICWPRVLRGEERPIQG